MVRPLFPVDETRYVSVAWEMWVRNDFLVPHLNGETYSHKPPLLFWLMQLSWFLFGVNEWTPRIIAPAFALASVYLTASVARLLWPEYQRTAVTAPLMLIGSLFWSIYSTLTMFDALMAFFVLLGVYSVGKLVHSGLNISGIGLLGLAIGGGLLSKGPVILLYLLPVALSAPWWLNRKFRSFRWINWYLSILLAVVIGVLIALAWAIPAGRAGGEAYQNAIFLDQTSGRLVQSFAHRLPWWWYLQTLPLQLLPWIVWRPFWLGIKQLNTLDYGIRFCLSWIVPVFVAFSLISGKRIHYLLPLMPVLALIISRLIECLSNYDWSREHRFYAFLIAVMAIILLFMPVLNGAFYQQEALSRLSPVWGFSLFVIASVLWFYKPKTSLEAVASISITSLSLISIAASGFFSVNADRYDLRETARKIAELKTQNIEIVHQGKYHGQYNFLGRLTDGLPEVSDVWLWAANHPEGYIVVKYKPAQALPGSLFFYRQPFKNRMIAIVSATNMLENEALKDIIP